MSVIHDIEASGAAKIVNRLGLGQLGFRNRAAERVLVAPARPKALFRFQSPGRSPGLMLPRPRSLSRAKYPVSLLTACPGGV